MKNLIVVRHGNYRYKTGDLTQVGEEQIEKLSEFLKEIVSGKCLILSSDRLRVLRSAWILKDKLRIKKNIEVLYELCCEEEYLSKKEAKEIHKVIYDRKGEADNLILTDHFAVAQGYPAYFTQKEKWEKPVNIKDIGKGRAVCLNLEREVWRLSPAYK